MRVRLDEIGPEGLKLDRELTAQWTEEALGDGSPFRPKGEGRIEVQLFRAENDVHARGTVKLRLGAECSRCLESIDLDFNTPLDVTLVPLGKEPAAGTDGEVAEDDMGISTYQDEVIDLTMVVRDEVFLGLPMNPLCSEDCVGLCPTCGQNRNETECECRPVGDLRWEQLRRIKLS